MPMLAAVLAIALRAPAPIQNESVAPDVLPYGAAPELNAAVQKIAKLTQIGDFPSAKALLHLIPHREIRVQWDDSGVPEAARIDYAAARDLVFREWASSAGIGQYSLVSSAPDVLVSFSRDRAFDLKWSEDGPRLTVTLGLNPAGKTLDPSDMHNELSFAIGSYLGVAKLPIEGLIMHGQDVMTGNPVGLTPLESAIARTTLSASLKIAEDVEQRRKVPAGTSSLVADLHPVKIGPIVQGTVVPLEFNVKNGGDGTLVYRLIPDCSCFATSQRPTSVAPGSQSIAKAQMQTVDFSAMVRKGAVHKTLYLFSNDPVAPVRSVPVDVQLTPRYRILPPPQVFVVDKGVTVEAYLFTPPDHPLAITGASSEGLPGDVTVQPWEGEMADPDMNEGPQHRKGYKLTLKLNDVPPGSQFGTAVVIGTDDPNFPTITYPIYVQKGIVALPSRLNMGEVGTAPRKMQIHLLRPNQPFGITGLTVDSQHIAAKADLVKPGEYLITVSYDGAAAKGDYLATISIATDDPKQKLIQIQVNGTVR